MKVGNVRNGELKTRAMMYTQQMRYLTLDSVEALERRVQELKEKGLLRYAYILHDKDTDKEGRKIESHVHLMMEFDRSLRIGTVARVIEDKPQQFEAMTKRGLKNGVENGFAYLIHRTKKASNKYQYEAKKVVANFDYAKFIKIIDERLTPDDILELLNDGKIDTSGAIRKMQEIGPRVLAKNKRRIEIIGEVALECKYEKWLDEHRKNKKILNTVWFYGPSGTGKTRFAIDWACGRNYKYFITGGQNDPFQGYAGEQVLIIDEMRPELFNYADLLKILDQRNYEKITVARYKNAKIMADIIIVTSPYSPEDFYKHIPNVNRRIDKVDQLIRRVGLTLSFSQEYIVEMKYMPDMHKYIRGSRRLSNNYSGNSTEPEFNLDDFYKKGLL